MTPTPYRTEAATALYAEATRAFMNRVYMWMFVGLGITGATAVYVASSEPAFNVVASNYKFFAIGLMVFTWFAGSALLRLSAGAASALFVVYSAALGALLSTIFYIYEIGSISRIFFLSAGMFAALSIYGTVTKKDLSAWRTFLFMGVIGIAAAVAINLFWPTPMLSFVAACAGVLVFSGLAAYDTQKLRQMGAEAEANGARSIAIAGALHLYLDFINLFLSLLRLLGNRR